MKKKGTVVVVAGPTATGKTEAAILLALHYRTVVISCDSRQLYREMTIGTAVPSPEQLQQVPHYFIQSHSIHQYYNAYLYETEALDLLDSLFKTHRIVIVAGGSGLYLDALCKGIDDLPTIDPEVRKEVDKKYREEGIEYLRHQLRILDPAYYEKVDLRNPKRMQKAIEVCLMTGRPYSSMLTGMKKERPFHIIKTGLMLPREELYKRIHARIHRMIEAGLVEEARSLLPWRHLNPLNTVGYRELFEYFDQRLSLPQAIERIRQNTRKYAKRQITWFQRDSEIRWFHPDEISAMIQCIDEQIADCLKEEKN